MSVKWQLLAKYKQKQLFIPKSCLLVYDFFSGVSQDFKNVNFLYTYNKLQDFLFVCESECQFSSLHPHPKHKKVSGTFNGIGLNFCNETLIIR